MNPPTAGSMRRWARCKESLRTNGAVLRPTTIGGSQMEQVETRSPERVVETGITRRSLLSSSGGLAAGTVLFGAPGIAALANTAHASPSRGCATPVGFRKLLVYIAEGPASAGSVRDVDAVLAFQQEIMGRDAATVATY